MNISWFQCLAGNILVVTGTAMKVRLTLGMMVASDSVGTLVAVGGVVLSHHEFLNLKEWMRGAIVAGYEKNLQPSDERLGQQLE